MMGQVDHSSNVDGREAPVEPGVVKSGVQHTINADVFARLATELHEAPTVEETVEAVVEFALQAERCAYAGLVLALRGGRAEIAAVTDPVVQEIFKLQIDTGIGPMLTALSGGTIQVPDVASDTRWPGWAAKAAVLGLRSAMHVPLRAGAGPIGVLSLLHTEPHAFDADDEAVAHILARHASVAVADAQQDESLAQAVDARKVVGQAMGILMERFDVNGDQAFEMLKRMSQSTNTKLQAVAQGLIDTRSVPR
jgi:GAF domain-containing protein